MQSSILVYVARVPRSTGQRCILAPERGFLNIYHWIKDANIGISTLAPSQKLDLKELITTYFTLP